ncbi:uncharacterized protein LOC129322446 [Prosopis cineraria]|uniref:uncharacterized protein LOC129322446 n=1 Tax=Prosopis cineraria TaxID=364024 RepID=UPI00240FE47C|nr:uncharacterized protein LOC129322446 [Prosopis cineraria]
MCSRIVQSKKIKPLVRGHTSRTKQGRLCNSSRKDDACTYAGQLLKKACLIISGGSSFISSYSNENNIGSTESCERWFARRISGNCADSGFKGIPNTNKVRKHTYNISVYFQVYLRLCTYRHQYMLERKISACTGHRSTN